MNLKYPIEGRNTMSMKLGRHLHLALAIVILLTMNSVGFAGEGNGGQAGSFLRIPVGARPAGMGNAFVSVADDAYALYFNPGGLYQLKSFTFGTMYSVMSMDRSHFQGSFSYNSEGLGVFALMFTKFGVAKIDGRDSGGNKTGSFDDSELAFNFGYGKELIDHLGVGAAIKYISHSLQDNRATGLGLDIGTHTKIETQHSIIKAIRLGLSISNLGSELKWNTHFKHFGSDFGLYIRATH
jgi:hypothetical protein